MRELFIMELYWKVIYHITSRDLQLWSIFFPHWKLAIECSDRRIENSCWKLGTMLEIGHGPFCVSAVSYRLPNCAWSVCSQCMCTQDGTAHPVHSVWTPSAVVQRLFLFSDLPSSLQHIPRDPGYRIRGPGFHFRRYQIVSLAVGLQRGPISLMRITEKLHE
jgi:hypothetical protein